MIKTFARKITVGKWEERGGGFKPEELNALDNEVNSFIVDHPKSIVLQFTTTPIFHHNNGGYDEILATYSVAYSD